LNSVDFKSTSIPFTVAQLDALKLPKKNKLRNRNYILGCYACRHVSVCMYYLKSDSTGENKGITEEMYKTERE